MCFIVCNQCKKKISLRNNSLFSNKKIGFNKFEILIFGLIKGYATNEIYDLCENCSFSGFSKKSK